MDKNRTIDSSSMITLRKVPACFLVRKRFKRAIRATSKEVSNSMQEVALLLRIMIFLRSAKDYESVLKLYGIDDHSKGVNKKFAFLEPRA